jgi:predicted flap endonuclease-1-like 5' DNA nuclease
LENHGNLQVFVVADFDRVVTRLLEYLSTDTGERERREVDAPTDLKFVGPATSEAVEDAGFSAQDIADKNVSYSMLLEAGVNPGVAAKIRRYHSLSWSFDNDGGDLNRRSEQVRGLQDDERAWVADSGVGDDSDDETTVADDLTVSEDDGEAEWVANAAADADTEPAEETTQEEDPEAAWVADAGVSTEPATADGSGDPLAAEAAWRERSKPTPLTDISGIGETYSDQLAEAGVTSVRSLATASPELLSDVTGIPEPQLREWHHEASELAD